MLCLPKVKTLDDNNCHFPFADIVAIPENKLTPALSTAIFNKVPIGPVPKNIGLVVAIFSSLVNG